MHNEFNHFPLASKDPRLRAEKAAQSGRPVARGSKRQKRKCFKKKNIQSSLEFSRSRFDALSF